MYDAAPLSVTKQPHPADHSRSPVARSADALLIGVAGPMAAVSGRVAAVLLTRAGLITYQRQHRGDDPEVDAALLALVQAALWYRDRSSADRHQVAPMTDIEARCALTTGAAADRIGCTQRTIVRAIHSGQLAARKIGRQWLINPDDFQQYADQRI